MKRGMGGGACEAWHVVAWHVVRGMGVMGHVGGGTEFFFF